MFKKYKAIILCLGFCLIGLQPQAMPHQEDPDLNNNVSPYQSTIYLPKEQHHKKKRCTLSPTVACLIGASCVGLIWVITETQGKYDNTWRVQPEALTGNTTLTVGSLTSTELDLLANRQVYCNSLILPYLRRAYNETLNSLTDGGRWILAYETQGEGEIHASLLSSLELTRQNCTNTLTPLFETCRSAMQIASILKPWRQALNHFRKNCLPFLQFSPTRCMQDILPLVLANASSAD